MKVSLLSVGDVEKVGLFCGFVFYFLLSTERSGERDFVRNIEKYALKAGNYEKETTKCPLNLSAG